MTRAHSNEVHAEHLPLLLQLPFQPRGLHLCLYPGPQLSEVAEWPQGFHIQQADQDNAGCSKLVVVHVVVDRLLVVGKMMDIALEIGNLSETVMRETLFDKYLNVSDDGGEISEKQS